ncbi:HNH endonuclease [Rhizobium binxianense]
MRRIGPYTAASVASFDTMLGDLQPDLQAVLGKIKAKVGTACSDYDVLSPEVHTRAAIAVTKRQRKNLIESYDRRPVAIKRRLASMRDTLAPENADLCPYCSLDTNPDLDHFLPKAVFPEFSLHGTNLVPICTPCNRKKLNSFATATGDRMFLHPSHEPSVDTPVLRASLGFPGGQGLTVTYDLMNPGMPGTEWGIVERHFGRLNLADRYARRAASYLAAFKKNVTGMDWQVVDKIVEDARSSSTFGEPTNGWRPTLFRAVPAVKVHLLAWLTS